MPEVVGSIDPSLHLAKLSFHAAEIHKPLPDWASWCVSLGRWLQSCDQLTFRRVVVVRLATRRLAAAFSAFGALLGDASRFDELESWASLLALAPGTPLRWREPDGEKTAMRSGVMVGATEAYGQTFIEVAVSGAARRRNTHCMFNMPTSMKYAMTQGVIDDDADERLSDVGRVMAQTMSTFRPGWLRTVGTACSIVTNRASFEGDLQDTCLAADDGSRSRMTDLILATDGARRVHGKSMTVPIRQFGVLDRRENLTILDGAAALQRFEDTRASRMLVLLDSAEYDDVASDSIRTLLDYGETIATPPPPWLVCPPPGVEALCFDLGVASPQC